MQSLLKKLPLLIILVASLAAAIGLRLNGVVGQSTHPSGADSSASTRVDELAANFRFSLPDLNGQLQHSDQWQGKFLIINFWASWCGPCLEEMPRFISLQQQYGDQGVQFVGIGIDQADALARIVKRLGVNYPVLQGDFDAMEVAKKFGNLYGVLPYTTVIGPDGKRVIEFAGAVREGEMEQLIRQHLAKSPAGSQNSSH